MLNPLASRTEATPSSLDGVPATLERDLRAYGAVLIQQAGIMLKAPQVVMSTAQVLFQRFFFVTSLKDFGIRDIGLGALFLASKLEESPLRIRDIVNVYSYILALSSYCSTPPFPSPASYTAYTPIDFFASEFYDRKDALVIAEMQILKRLGFQTQVALPYGHLVNYLKVLDLTPRKDLVQKSWGYLNDMLQTPAPALYPESTLAIAAIYLAARTVTPQISLPLDPVPWFTVFDASEQDILAICRPLLSLYADWSGKPVWSQAANFPIEKNGVRLRIVSHSTANEP